MTMEEQLKKEILSRYKSIRAFTTDIGIPYSTLDSVFKRGISNSGVSTMIKIFSALGLDVESIQSGKLKKKTSVVPFDISEEAHQIARDYDGLDSHGRTVTRLLISEEQKRMAAEQRRNETDNPAVEVMAHVEEDAEAFGERAKALAQEQFAIEKKQDASASSVRGSAVG